MSVAFDLSGQRHQLPELLKRPSVADSLKSTFSRAR